MPLDPGIFELKTATDLFSKLERDFAELQRQPTNSDMCFNFFVTAEHLPEWYFQGDTKKASQLRAAHALLRTCSHIANGGKHFQVTNPKHRSIESTHESVVIYFAPDGSGEPGRFERRFKLTLDGREAAELGCTVVSAQELAKRLVDFWRAQLQLQP